jgi:hypothetical protein
MNSMFLPTTREIGEMVTVEVVAAGGLVSDCYEDGRRVFLRSILPGVREVRAGDGLQGGVAVMAADEEVCVRPYVFRQVCTNGAIMAWALETRSIERAGPDATPYEVEEVARPLREDVRACLAPEVFARATRQIQLATHSEADLSLSVLPQLIRLSGHHAIDLLAEIASRFHSDRDSSVFGLMNAVTSVARDQRDPAVRWRLEEAGGQIAAMAPAPSRDPARREAVSGVR